MPDIESAALAEEIQADPQGIGYPAWDGEKATRRQIINLLCGRRDVPNPEPVPQVFDPLTLPQLIGNGIDGLVSHESIVKFSPEERGRVFDAVDAGDVERLGALLQIAGITGYITADELTACQTRLQQTIPDPDHSATILSEPRITELFGVSVMRSADLDAALEAIAA